jgi:hypothetical protein
MLKLGRRGQGNIAIDLKVEKTRRKEVNGNGKQLFGIAAISRIACTG